MRVAPDMTLTKFVAIQPEFTSLQVWNKADLIAEKEASSRLNLVDEDFQSCERVARFAAFTICVSRRQTRKRKQTSRAMK